MLTWTLDLSDEASFRIRKFQAFVTKARLSYRIGQYRNAAKKTNADDTEGFGAIFIIRDKI